MPPEFILAITAALCVAFFYHHTIIKAMLVWMSRRELVIRGQVWTDGQTKFWIGEINPDLALFKVYTGLPWNLRSTDFGWYSRASFNNLGLWLTNDTHIPVAK